MEKDQQRVFIFLIVAFRYDQPVGQIAVTDVDILGRLVYILCRGRHRQDHQKTKEYRQSFFHREPLFLYSFFHHFTIFTAFCQAKKRPKG